MEYLTITNSNKTLTASEKDRDNEVRIGIYDIETGNRIYLTKQDAIQIIDHLKKQFEL